MTQPQSPRTPRISGAALRSLARVAVTGLGSRALYRALRSELHIDELRTLPDALRGDIPLDNHPLQARAPRKGHDARLPVAGAPWSSTSATLSDAYARGTLSPEEVVRRAIDSARSLATQRPPVGPILEYADESAHRQAALALARYRAGKPIGPLDGVPIAIKEQISVRGLARRNGTTSAPATPEAADATCVARLRAAGAIVLGTTMMTEYGMSPVGHNAGRVMPHNPHKTDHVAGGSSTGSGVAVSTGIVPLAVGADGGGSIRVPSCLNGVFGIKPTWGRVSRAGAAATDSVSHIGPLASSVLDLARALEVMGPADPGDPQTAGAPAIDAGSLERAVGRGVAGLRIGVMEDEWGAANPQIAAAGKAALDALVGQGAVLVPANANLARRAAAIGYLVIGCEAFAALRRDWMEHREQICPDLQISLASLAHVSAADYTDAQRLRAGLRREIAGLFGDVDLLALPTTAATAPAVTPAQMASGFLDPGALDAMCRFAFLANLTGLPAASAPVGLDTSGLPMGLQLVGDAWDEATVLAAAGHLERIGAARVERPRASVALTAG